MVTRILVVVVDHPLYHIWCSESRLGFHFLFSASSPAASSNPNINYHKGFTPVFYYIMFFSTVLIFFILGSDWFNIWLDINLYTLTEPTHSRATVTLGPSKYFTIKFEISIYKFTNVGIWLINTKQSSTFRYLISHLSSLRTFKWSVTFGTYIGFHIYIYIYYI